MPSRKLLRTTYRDPQPPHQPREFDVLRSEAALDMDEFYRPLEQIHASGLHGWGVADGLRITATLASAAIKVGPGIAVDAQGRHVALAEGGSAEIGRDADAPSTPPTLAPVAADGVTLPTTGLNGQLYVAIQWRETFDLDAFGTHNIFRFHHTPWIRLVPIAEFADDGARLVLGRLTLDAAGKVTGLSHDLRRATSLPAQTLKLRRAATTAGSPDLAVDDTPSAEIRSRPAGGLEIAVPAASDEIHLQRDGGTFAKLAVAADTVEMGAAGRGGALHLKDTAGQNAISLDGASGTISARSLAPNAADKVINVNDVFSFRIHGSDFCLDGRSGKNNRTLVDMGDQLIVNFHSDYRQGVLVDSNLAVGGTLQSGAPDGTLHVQATNVRIHGSDLILDGRSKKNNRALVDMNDRLAINFNGDYHQGVLVHSDLETTGAVRSGDLVIRGELRSAAPDALLHVHANQVRIHGSDLILDGRSKNTNRALVDMGNQLVVNFHGDYRQGVVVDSNLVVNGRVRSKGADCAEQFDVVPEVMAEPGTVMVIGADGSLEPCAVPYDARVAGVVSGAGDLEPALVLNEQPGSRAIIALIGTVYCKVDASHAPISAGDLLTTSDRPGHAMKAVDADRRFGAVIGKALKPLSSGIGLIPILATNL